MPLYNLACRTSLAAETRHRVAVAITDTHCRLTGAPAAFVNVVFVDGYPLRSGLAVDAVGGVRNDGNRTPELIERLRVALRDAIAAAAGLAPPQVAVELIGVPSSWVMEGGRVMPAPGTEAVER
jgi:phenylpyruvate tautomerase PptA (4-oxalocrotonate tautomerase family)